MLVQKRSSQNYSLEDVKRSSVRVLAIAVCWKVILVGCNPSEEQGLQRLWTVLG